MTTRDKTLALRDFPRRLVEIKAEAGRLVEIKAEAGRLGLLKTMHALEAATQAVGYELAEHPLIDRGAA